ncbi:MAG TPA: DMT family transporter [Actinomycetota bacterium]|nr:DMT family transporter [Actinomycetota bacterium]
MTAEPKPRNEDAIGGALIVLASLMFGIVVVLGRIVEQGPKGMPVPMMLAIRFGGAAVLLFALLVVLRRPPLPARGERLGLGILAVAGYAVESSLFFLAVQHGEAAAVTLLFFTYPIVVTAGSMALGQGAPGRVVLLSLASAIAGSALVILAGGGLAIQGLGVAFALAAAGVYSCYLLGVDRVVRMTEPLAGAMWVSLFASLGLVVYAAVSGNLQAPDGLRQWAPLVGMGAATAAAFVCLFAGLRRLGPVRTAVVAATEPLAATVLAFLFLDQPIRPGVVAGGLLILGGAIAASLARGGAPAVEPEVP